MKKITLIFSLILVNLSFGQEIKEVKVGKTFQFAYPTNYLRTYTLNTDASLQLSNAALEKYSIIIQDEKASLKSVNVLFSNLEEAIDFYTRTLISNLTDNTNKKTSKVTYRDINGYPSVEKIFEGDLIDEETKEIVKINYVFTLVETPDYYYQILSWSPIKLKEKLLPEFRAMANSFKENP